MSKYDFIVDMRKALAGKVEVETIEESVLYYEDYIDVEIKKGRTEREVLEGLGDPRLIAKSIVAANGGSGERQKLQGDNVYEQDTYRAEENEGGRKPFRIVRLPGWLILFIMILVFFVVFSLLGSLLAFLAPIFVPAFIIIIVVYILRRK